MKIISKIMPFTVSDISYIPAKQIAGDYNRFIGINYSNNMLRIGVYFGHFVLFFGEE